ncbi:MAG: hypothetical protein KC643_28550 [Nitrospira sp.]|nr:hypothetical protein [Nitrospira sp.]
MSKKSFSRAPRPKQLTPETIDAYVHGGAGHDTRASAPKSGERSLEGTTKRLSLDLPEEAHRRFKVACAATGRKMATELTIFIERRTKELEQEALN